MVAEALFDLSFTGFLGVVAAAFAALPLISFSFSAASEDLIFFVGGAELIDRLVATVSEAFITDKTAAVASIVGSKSFFFAIFSNEPITSCLRGRSIFCFILRDFEFKERRESVSECREALVPDSARSSTSDSLDTWLEFDNLADDNE